MNKSRRNSEDHLDLMRAIKKQPHLSQRDMAKELGFSLGKLNYCLTELKKKGFVKMNNFSKSQDKLRYFYVLTPSGIAAKTRLTINFMKRKMKEYDELKKEIKK